MPGEPLASTLRGRLAAAIERVANVLPEPLAIRVRALASGVRFGQFVSVGVVGALVDTTVLLVLAEGVGVAPEIATIVGIESAILVMFAVNDRWTFAGEGHGDHRSLASRLLRSHAVRAVGSTTQFVVFVVVFRHFFVAIPVLAVNLWLLVAKGAGIGLGMLVNYVFESLFTWRVHE